ncbi:MAG: HNH endonuclease signature motif containing protein, partial [Microthrixaceae bacterium]
MEGIEWIGATPEALAVQARRRELDDRIGVLSAQIHALEAELAATVAEFDAEQGWQGGDFRSLGHWLSVRAKFLPSDAQRVARVAERLESVPTLFTEALAGRVSLGVLAAAARVSTPENETRVAQIALDCTPSQATRVLGKYRDLKAMQDHDPACPHSPDDENCHCPAPDDGERPVLGDEYWWRLWHDERGRGRLDAALDPVTAALVHQAWLAAQTVEEKHLPDPEPGEPRVRLTPNEIASRFASIVLDHADRTGVRAEAGEKFLVQLNLDIATLARILGITLDPALPVQMGSECFLASTGRHLSDTEAAKFLCDANIQVLVHHRGVPLWLSKETESFTRHQRRALRFRASNGGCEFPGCLQQRYLHGHHVIYRTTHNGPTALDNGVLLCGHHHRMLHTKKWTVTSNSPQSFTFWDRHRCLGTTTLPEHPGGPPPDLAHLPDIEPPPPP